MGGRGSVGHRVVASKPLYFAVFAEEEARRHREEGGVPHWRARGPGEG